MRNDRPTAGALGVIAGSGLHDVCAAFDTRLVARFADVPGVGRCTVPGHAGEFREATVGSSRVVFALGRRHVYEGAGAATDALIAYMAERGVSALVTVSAAGGLDRFAGPGSLVRVCDIIDLQHRRHAAPGPPPEVAVRARARDTLRLDAQLGRRLDDAARAARVPLGRGTLACLPGPVYETPAEVRTLQGLGADLVTMSAAPEVAAANAAGIPVAAIGAITNLGTGMGATHPEHTSVLSVAGQTAGELADIVTQLMLSW